MAPPAIRPGEGDSARMHRLRAVVRPIGTSPLRVVCTDARFRGIMTHWHDGTRAHSRVGCWYCGNGCPLKVDGYIGAQRTMSGEEVVAALSVHAMADLAEIAAREGGLRGADITLQRMANRSNGRVCVVFNGKRAESQLPPALDIMPDLRRLFGLWPGARLEEVADPLAAPAYIRAAGEGEEGGGES